MHENDLELVKILHQKCMDAEDRLTRISGDLESCRSDLALIEDSASSRVGYADILRQVAESVDRQDLVVELPDSAELKARCEELTQEHDALQSEAGRFRGLLDQLTERAPGLLEAAGLSPRPPAVIDQADERFEADSAAMSAGAAETPLEQASEPKAEEPVPESDKFNIKTIKRRETSSHGPGAVYIIDGSSVLSRIPLYDFSQRAVDEAEIYQELARDLCELGENISGSFCILTGSELDLEDKVSSAISIVGPDSNGSAEPDDRLSHLLRLADEYTGRLRNVCVVTGESDVLAAVRDRGMHTMSLSEFFMT